MAAIVLVGGAALLLNEPAAGAVTRATLFAAGLALIAAGVLIRVWASLHIAGRKTRELVAGGPYSATRNPLYLGALAGVCGAALTFGSVVLALFVTGCSFAVFHWVVKKEEQRMREEFGSPFDRYAQETPRWLPRRRPKLAGRVEAPVANVVRTLGEALLFLLAPALAVMADALRAYGAMEPLLRLP